MVKYIKADEWCIVEEGFNPENHRSSESIFSIGNGRMGQRANFEEKYSGETLQGSYIGGVYYNDRTRVGHWKNGYPESFSKVLNVPNWTGIDIFINGEGLDLAQCKTEDFVRVLNMKEGVLERSFIACMTNGNRIAVKTRRFISMAEKEMAVISYSVTPLNFTGEITFVPYIDGNVKNEDANFNEKFWDITGGHAKKGHAFLSATTRETAFYIGIGMRYAFETPDTVVNHIEVLSKEGYLGNKIAVDAATGKEVVFTKYVAVLSSLNHELNVLRIHAEQLLDRISKQSFESLFDAHRKVWADIWAHSDIIIEGDVEAQQAIRFNIFQLNQTYTGDDARLNIGPKGFTGEKYGGNTYWDTEIYCVPFYLGTAPAGVAKNLLLYRYKQLEKAIENAQKLGFKNGAALYPMATMNGEESHNEWEITFEAIHRNGAIAYAIYNYVNYTGDEKYLEEYGLPVLIGISRFWAQRTTWSKERKKYVILGVTGPNEYENNVNNNWYTNKLAVWCMRYTMKSMRVVREQNPVLFAKLQETLSLDFDKETAYWMDICEKMYFPESKEEGIFLQQDGYMDKEQLFVKDLDSSIRPLNQHWSWDRILRSCFIKQADVLQGIYCFEDEYDLDTIKRNFEFYEIRTVHESSLSAGVHAILACKLRDMEKAYNLYLRAARLDLDDYNKEVSEGLHITSMAGTWMSVVMGFGGMRVKNGILTFNPIIPDAWKSYSFHVSFRGQMVKVYVEQGKFYVRNESDKDLFIGFGGERIKVEAGENVLMN
ncbi:glycoside hydrolase family 65 protein [Porphyromonadaceae bacterium OttesenSCG-928-L07]|nr:glycoside hydrolase family 65 protein [Porphyromonadaceae bacterium OttesenSCG-928-L07]MDL2251851.1 glycoside hydrolase family 65 protein [Odoribacter sp. OttesenSCG-928-J03]MDL2330540.1 glycoside hydrolase family 65 protein [Odoribacter sp. OttesenSCG-928-A06]